MPLKVYYLDDEEKLCEIFVDCFESEDLEIMTFTDPVKAIAQCLENPPDVFFVDYRLPGITGEDVAKSLPADIPKYLITGDITLNCEYKFKAVFGKPYKPQDIQRVLDGCLIMKFAP